MRLLLVSPYLPHRGVGHGGGISTYRLAIALARRHEITVLCFQRSNEREEHRRDLEGFGVRVETVPFRSGVDRGPAALALLLDRATRAMRALATGRPYVVARYERAAMRHRLEELLVELRPSAVQVEYESMAPYARWARDHLLHHPELWPTTARTGAAARPLVVLNTHEVGVLPRLRRLVTAAGGFSRRTAAVELARWARYESQCVRWADLVLCVTEQDRVLLQGMTGAPGLITLPLGVDAAALPEVSRTLIAPPRLLFVGSFDHLPNRDAARLLVGEVFPRVRQQWADARLDIVGRNPPSDVRAAAQAAPDGAVEVHGFVEDLHALFERAWMFVAPVFSGGGIKIKILEAMGRGIPVLTSPFGLEGIDARAGVEVALGADPQQIANQACALLGQPDALRRLGAAGRRLICERYSWERIADELTHHLDRP